ncbi:glycosyltransferase [Bacteroides caecimuris]|uniref:glycosyltransferase n=1 Tax=Bacteroides caecimuris TaxID=1796613 RepID=UPI00257384C9|nr:glycosyltransferase [Bacteroides caecimuris]
MKISLITLHTPTKENVKGASALPYHLISNASPNFSFNIYSFNLNGLSVEDIKKIENELGAKISTIRHNRVFSLIRNRLLFPLRIISCYSQFHYLRLPDNIISQISSESDAVWIYAEDIGHLAYHFNASMRCVVTTPDCEALFYNRVLSLPSKLKSFFFVMRYSRAYWQYLNVAKNLPLKNVTYHLVGKEDCVFLKKISQYIDAVYLPHPHYEGNTDRKIKFSKPRIRLLIPGRYDFYCEEAIDEAITAIAGHPELSRFYEISFQGKNWEKPASILRSAGFDVNMIGFVPQYKDELCRHDIQISPIITGTGTKGKVLDAFVNGLLVIATERAIENIHVEDKKDYLFYSNSQELIALLTDIPNNVEYYEKIAETGRKSVLSNHNPQAISRKFFNLFNK